MPRPTKHRPEDLIARVQQLLKDEGQEHLGTIWLAYDQPALAQACGMSIATLRRLTSKPPFMRLSIRDPESRGKRVLLRLMAPGDGYKLPTKTIANQMVSAFNRATGGAIALEGGPLPKKEYSLLCGLAEDLPAGLEVPIFNAVLKDWSGFKSCVVAEQNVAEDAGEQIFYAWQDFPHIGTIRRYWRVAVELYLMEMQAAATFGKGEGGL